MAPKKKQPFQDYNKHGFRLEGVTKRAIMAKHPAISRSTIPSLPLPTANNHRRAIVKAAAEDNPDRVYDKPAGLIQFN